MQWLVELMAGFVAMIAAAALSQFGLDLRHPTKEPEVRRMRDCAPSSFLASAPEKQDPQNC